MTADIAIHDAQVWKDSANFLIFADLSTTELPGRWEQLWARQVGDAEFELCCVPYFTYGLALGDRVRTHASSGKRYVIADVHVKSGRRVFRLWLKKASVQGRERVHKYLESQSPLHEWSSDNLVAIDVPANVPDLQVSALLADLPSLGVEFEWGD